MNKILLCIDGSGPSKTLKEGNIYRIYRQHKVHFDHFLININGVDNGWYKARFIELPDSKYLRLLCE